mmetsp:Transcript_1264/g.1667  ORF Transcript_1264/g.1667 Transcript_1264/m.1667 type:complete len:128 (-) Transcript_1264:406-789(-)
MLGRLFQRERCHCHKEGCNSSRNKDKPPSKGGCTHVPADAAASTTAAAPARRCGSTPSFTATLLAGKSGPAKRPNDAYSRIHHATPHSPGALVSDRSTMADAADVKARTKGAPYRSAKNPPATCVSM